MNTTKQQEKNGRKTINDALITISHAGAIASMMMLVLCVGAVAGAFPADRTNSDLITIHEHLGSDIMDYQIPVELNALNFDFTKAQPNDADGTAAVTVLANESITGKVTDSATGLGIEGATVTADGATTQTNSVGSCTISLKAGTYTVSASKVGYVPKQVRAVVEPGLPKTVDFELVRDYVELELKAGETTTKVGNVNEDILFNLTVTNHGEPATYSINNSRTTANVVIIPSTTGLLNDSTPSASILVTINASTNGSYPVTISAINVSSSKSADITLIAFALNRSENGTCDDSSNVDDASELLNGTLVQNGSTVNESTVTSSVVDNSTVLGANVTASFLSEDTNVTGGEVTGSTLTNTTTTDTNVTDSELEDSTTVGGTIESSTVTGSNTTGTDVADSILVGVNATGGMITGVTLQNIELTNATVWNKDGKATILGGTGAKVNTSGEGGVEVHFENVYEDIAVEDLVKNQTVPQPVQSNVTVNTTPAEAAKVGASISLNSSEGGSVTISRCGINPGGSTFALQGFSGGVIGDYLHIDSTINESAMMTVTFCIYYGTTEPGNDKKIVWYNEDTGAWESMPTTKEHKADGWYLCTETDHLSIYAVATTAASDPITATFALEIAVGSRPFDDAADVSGDGRVTSLDALMILQAASEAIEL